MHALADRVRIDSAQGGTLVELVFAAGLTRFQSRSSIFRVGFKRKPTCCGARGIVTAICEAKSGLGHDDFLLSHDLRGGS